MTVQPLIAYTEQGSSTTQIIDLNKVTDLSITPCPSVSVTTIPPPPPPGGGGGLVMLLGIGFLGIMMTGKKEK
jgi:hypothetical protein